MGYFVPNKAFYEVSADIPLFSPGHGYDLPGNRRYYGVKCDIVVTDEYTISYYIELHNKLYHGITISKKNKHGQYLRGGYSQEEIFGEISTSLLGQSGLDHSSTWWVAWKYFSCNDVVDFYRFNEYALKCNEDSFLNEYIHCLVTETTNTLEHVKSILQMPMQTNS